MHICIIIIYIYIYIYIYCVCIIYVDLPSGLRHFGREQASAEEVVSYLEGVYCGPISVETSQLSTLEEREWMAERFEELRQHTFSPEERRRLATIMLQSQVRPVTQV